MTSRRTGRLLAVALLAAGSLGAGHAAAEEPQNAAATEALFKRSVELMAQHDYAAACPGIAEVVRRTPDGIGARLVLAECYEGAGKLASAWATWQKARAQASVAGQNDRVEKATSRAAALEPRLSHLVITVPAEVAALPGLVVKYDDIASARAEWSLPLPVDGGKHVVSASANDRVAWSAEVEVANEKARVEVPVPMLQPAQAAPPVAPPPPVAATPPVAPAPAPAPPPPAPAREPSRGGVPAWVWVAGGAGLAMLGASVAFKVDQGSAAKALDSNCGATRHCKPGYDWQPVYDRERRDFGLFVGLGGAGILALGAAVAGAAVGLHAKSEPTTAWTVTPVAAPGQPAGLVVGRGW